MKISKISIVIKEPKGTKLRVRLSISFKRLLQYGSLTQKGAYNAKSAMEKLVNSHASVPWYKVVWGKKHVSRHALSCGRN